MRLRFETEEAFHEWKEGYEKTNFMHWIRPTGRHVNRSRNSRIEWREYYRCSRDGDYRKYEGSRKTERRQKRSGRQSSKLGKGGCQAHMKVWKPADTPYIVVDVFEEHTGHALGPENMQFLRKKPERQSISIDGVEEVEDFPLLPEGTARDALLPSILPTDHMVGLESLREFNGAMEPAVELVRLIRLMEGRAGTLTALVECARRIERDTREGIVSQHPPLKDSQDGVSIEVERGEKSSTGEAVAGDSRVGSSGENIDGEDGPSGRVEEMVERVMDRDGARVPEFELGEIRSLKKRKLKD
jgi:hypothetical protein